MRFKSSLERLDSAVWYAAIPVLEEHARPFLKKGGNRVVVKLNDQLTFQGALMPDGNGHFFINLNKGNRKKLKLELGDEVTVELSEDNSEYGLPLPEEFKELLDQDIDGAEWFKKLTPGKQRSLLYIIAKPKSSQLKIEKGIIVLTYLKENNGILDFKLLNQYFKDKRGIL